MIPMTMRHFFAFLSLLGIGATVLPSIEPLLGLKSSAAYAQEHELDAIEAKAAIKDALQKLGKKDTQRLEVREVLSCYPLHGLATNEFLCLLNMNSPEGGFRIEKLPFREVNSNWEFIPPTGNYQSVSASCPAKGVAEKLLRNSLRESELQVLSGGDEGSISDERGKNREKKGPLRLMCTYITKASLGEKTVVAYFRYRKGEYLIDPDHETWAN